MSPTVHSQERMSHLAEAIIARVDTSDLSGPAAYDDAHTAQTGTSGTGSIIGYAVLDLARQFGIDRECVSITERSRDLHLPLPWGPKDKDGVRRCRTLTHEWWLDQHWNQYEAVLRVRRVRGIVSRPRGGERA